MIEYGARDGWEQDADRILFPVVGPLLGMIEQYIDFGVFSKNLLNML